MKFLILRVAKSIAYFSYIIFLSIFGRNIKIGRRVLISLDSDLAGDNLINDDCRIISSSLGCYSYISPQSIIVNCKVGRYCSIGPGCKIGLGNHPLTEYSTSPYIYNDNLFKKRRDEDFSPVLIGNDCWIGANVLILGGITIGNGVIIGAGTIVTKSIPDFAIVVGSPGRVKRYRFDEETIKFINSSAWWDFEQDKARGILGK
ncbi:MAG: antibiotic acetyltransferase [Gammaproteobacteria bacterium]|nr:antibiotic acetyltransferase [Gammaproteobacteria bacterium]MBU1479123.1 antibiotic acetyltransferase [Gammaproteobacteria bacterium]MBU2003075.1 antibiotic acetyltransferase [Gammaproteobacteria bacterium]MBU2134271.1 antibiotic acetyltransferase [Gammaproteobacteria bacterium]MBU2187181.1 antibiotic acetyltransferase [Gammaproteobacteria bacterium]